MERIYNQFSKFPASIIDGSDCATFRPKGKSIQANGDSISLVEPDYSDLQKLSADSLGLKTLIRAGVDLKDESFVIPSTIEQKVTSAQNFALRVDLSQTDSSVNSDSINSSNNDKTE